MALLHTSSVKADLRQRLEALRPDSQRRWGKMSVGQMLWHVSETMESALGHVALGPQKVPLPRPILKFIVINLPWPKGAPTLKPWMPRDDRYDFAAERSRCLKLLDEMCAKSIDSSWPDSPSLGKMSGRDVSRLMAKHLNHHLTQFGV